MPDLLLGKRALVTSGPTHEPIDPVRFIANRSSGKQGHAIAEALAHAGAQVTLITGPVELPDPAGVQVVRVETAAQMMAACEAALPVDIAVFAAAVADWRPKKVMEQKLKKNMLRGVPKLALEETEDILATIAHHKTKRPKLVIGFAAETEQLLDHAMAKRTTKGADWMMANAVSEQSTFGSDDNEVTLITEQGREGWNRMSKRAIGDKLVEKIAATLATRRVA